MPWQRQEGSGETHFRGALKSPEKTMTNAEQVDTTKLAWQLQNKE